MKLLDGKQVSASIQQRLMLQMQTIQERGQPRPHLAALWIGDHAASHTYISAKMKACQQVGIASTLIHKPNDISQDELIDHIRTLNANPNVHGILVQLPLPDHIDEQVVVNAIDPSKDVDGFHVLNRGRLMDSTQTFIPATPLGILLLLEHYQIPTQGKHCVIIGRSNIVGRPLSILLSRNGYPGNCTVTLCHSQTRDLTDHCRQADILVAAMGKPQAITAPMVKEGAVVIDVGINRRSGPNNASRPILTGDVAFEQVAPKCSYITPVPGGVGPMTIAALLINTVRAAGYET